MGWVSEKIQVFAGQNGRRARFLADVAGVSTIEFAVIASTLATLAIGMLDFGIGLWQQMEVGNAARAGAEYASKYGFNTSAIQSAVTSATSLATISASPAPAEQCGCPDASSGVTLSGSPPCNTTTCSNGATASTYISVSAQASYTDLINC
jgi:Flp pilus assembly protein TadG